MSSSETDKQQSEGGPQTQLESPETPTSAPDSAAPAPQLPDGLNPALRREITVEIPADVVSKAWDGLIQSYSRKARVPGFRNGKVPASIIRQRFGSQIKSDVKESLVPNYFSREIQKQGLRPISQPFVRNLEVEIGQPIRFNATFEVMPDIELGAYQEIKIEKPEISVTDEEIENQLKRMQEQRVSFDPLQEERPLQDGDFAQIAYKAVPKAAPAEGGPADTAPASPEGAQTPPQDAAANQETQDALVEISGVNTIPEFSENLRGAKPGDERIFDVSYPEDFYERRLAGKSLTYTVKVNGLKKKTLPELNDDFAKEVSPEFETLDNLKERLRENITAHRKNEAERDAKQKLIEQLVGQYDFPIPESLIERQIEIRLDRGLQVLAQQGMSEDQMRRLDFEKLRGGQRESAIKEVKSTLLLDKIAELENIEISDEELAREIDSAARQMQSTPEALRKRLEESDGLERLRGRMRTDKALHLLYSKSA